MVLHSLKARLRSIFNVAVTQIADEDKWQKTTLAVVGVEKNRNTTNSVLSDVINFIESPHSVIVINYEMELI